MQQTTFFGKLASRPSLFFVLAGLLVMAVAAPAASAHHKPDHAGGPPWQEELTDSLSIDLQDIEVVDSEQGAGVFDGAFNITSFDIQDDQLFAVGNLTGTFTPDDGEVVEYDETVSVPVSAGGENDLGILQENGADRCPILFLELGPVFLDVLGLVVEIPDPIVLDIYAERGPGKLLGNLLCAIVGILDPVVADPVGTPLDRLIDNVNRLLERILGPA